MKKNTKTILIVVASLAGLCILCVIGSLIYSATPAGRAAATVRVGEKENTAVAQSTINAAPAQTEVPANTPTPTPTETPLPTSTPLYVAGGPYPTPQPDLYTEILSNIPNMTDVQFKEYATSMIGKRIHLEGEVIEVYEDYRILFTPDHARIMDRASVKGLPKDVVLKISKDQHISIDATIIEFTDLLGFQIDVAEPVLYWVR